MGLIFCQGFEVERVAKVGRIVERKMTKGAVKFWEAGGYLVWENLVDFGCFVMGNFLWEAWSLDWTLAWTWARPNLMTSPQVPILNLQARQPHLQQFLPQILHQSPILSTNPANIPRTLNKVQASAICPEIKKQHHLFSISLPLPTKLTREVERGKIK